MPIITCRDTCCIHNKGGFCQRPQIVSDGCDDFEADDTKAFHERELVKLRQWNEAMLEKKTLKIKEVIIYDMENLGAV